MAAVPDEILQHYAEYDESARITTGLGQLELARTQEIVRRFLPPGALDIADVGGGPGAHALWLADDGHRVHLIDPSPKHVALAQSLQPSGGTIQASLGIAAALPFKDASMDAVLLLGPMYHLTESPDRVAALREGLRVAKPGAPVFVAAISRYASLFDSVARRMLYEPRFRAIVERDLRDGQHRNPDNDPGWFTTAYLHHPDELRREAEGAGIAVSSVFGVEGLGAWVPSLAEDWEIPERREAIMWAAREIEAEPTLAGLSSHLLLVGHRAES